MNLPPCPIPGHDSTHHFHRANGTPCDATEVHGDCGTSIGPFSRCYSAHVPEPSPDEPAPLVTLPTVDQIAEAIVTDKGGPVTGEGWAKAVRDLLAAHVEPAEPTADEWVRVDVDTMIPEGVDFSKTSTNLWRVHKGHGPVYVRRSDLDKLAPPDPAAKLAAALTKAGDGTWNAADVRAALKSAGLTLGAEK